MLYEKGLALDISWENMSGVGELVMIVSWLVQPSRGYLA